MTGELHSHERQGDGTAEELARVQQELAQMHGVLADSAFYIRRLAGMLEGHPSRAQLRALEFVNRKLGRFERKIVPMESGDAG